MEAAAKNLAFHTTPYMTKKLGRLAEDFGMHNRWGPVQHAALASELLCTGRGPSGFNKTWAQVTTNTAETLNLMADRIDNDWRTKPKGCRRALSVEAGPCAYTRHRHRHCHRHRGGARACVS